MKHTGKGSTPKIEAQRVEKIRRAAILQHRDKTAHLKITLASRSGIRRKYRTDPEYRSRVSAKMSETARRLWNKPEYVKMQKEKCKALWLNPEFVRKRKAANRRQWKDPKFVKRIKRAQAKAIIKQSRWKGPNAPERELHSALRRNRIKYVSHKRILLGARSYTVPDAFLPEYNAAIYTDGVYWHSSKKVKRKDLRITGFLEEAGYETYRIDQGRPFWLSFLGLLSFLSRKGKK